MNVVLNISMLDSVHNYEPSNLEPHLVRLRYRGWHFSFLFVSFQSNSHPRRTHSSLFMYVTDTLNFLVVYFNEPLY